MLDASLRQLDLIYFNQLESRAGGCVRHFGDNRSGAGDGDDETVQVDLNAIVRLMPTCQYIGFVINSYSGQELNDVKAAHAHLYDTDRPKIYIASVDMASSHGLDCTAILMCCLFRSGNKLYLHIIGEGAAGKTAADNVDELQDYCRKHLRRIKQTAPTQAKLRATVPPGLRTGAHFKVQVPAGYFVNLQVPAGAAAGTIL